MANIKISELNQASQLDDADVLPVVQNGETKKVSVETIKDTFGNVAQLQYEVISTF